MHALEDEPEKKNRWRRFATGAGLAVGLGATLLITAQHVAPARRLMPEILQIAVVDDFPPPKNEPLPPPPPPPPPPPKPKKAEPEEEPVAQKVDEATPEPTDAPAAEAGLDATSFGAGGGAGIAFRTGTTQMGDPNKPAKLAKIAEPPKVALKPPKLTPARALDPELPKYPEAARKRNIQGFVLLEVEIDERGRLTSARVRQGLERELDQTALASVRSWKYQPAMIGGHPIASTRLMRIRFELN